MTTTLHTVVGPMGLDAALRTPMLDGAVVLLSAPAAYAVGRVSGGVARDAAGAALDVDSTYEARAFTASHELRWVRRGAEGTGQAALLCEEEPPEEFGEAVTPLDASATLQQTYVLWGEGTGHAPAAGWSELATARVGRIVVPVDDVQKGRRVHITAREYVTEDEHGNAAVVEERLTGMELV